MNKFKVLSIIIIVTYTLLFYQDVYSQPVKFFSSLNIHEALSEEWILEGLININPDMSLTIEGLVKNEGGESCFEITGSPNYKSVNQKNLGMTITGRINDEEVIINPSALNNEEIVISIYELLKSFDIVDTGELLNVDNIDQEDIKFLGFIEIDNGNMMEDIGSKYMLNYELEEGHIEVIVTLASDDIYQVKVGIVKDNQLVLNISLHQSHF